MSASNAFDFAAELLERVSRLDRLESRGTLRIALKKAGFDPKRIGSSELAEVLDRLLADELATRGVEGADSVVSQLVVGLSQLQVEVDEDSPEEIFRRISDGG